MEETFVIDYTEEVARDLRSERGVTVRLTDPKPLEVGFVLIANRGIPVWIAKVDSFTMPNGTFPKEVTISVGEVAALEQLWTEVSSLVRGVDIEHGKIVALKVSNLFAIGEKSNMRASTPVTLTAKAAIPRLAWTYGVTEANVKITIEF